MTAFVTIFGYRKRVKVDTKPWALTAITESLNSSSLQETREIPTVLLLAILNVIPTVKNAEGT